MLAALAKPLHPGAARIMGLMSLPDDAFDECFDGAEALEREHRIPLTRLEDFVQQQVRVQVRAAAA